MCQSLPRVISEKEELKAWRKTVSRDLRIGFVPTMGGLHRGHETLMEASKAGSDLTVLSIFVNPAQFAPNEDFETYPRTFENDLQMAARVGVDVVYAPKKESLYPTDYSTYVEERSMGTTLCGEFRPPFFTGVCTVVLKLFHLVQPHEAYFGLKDAQQYCIIRRMVRDLDMDIQIQGVPTVRQEDGLALSSRNTYLSENAKKKAPRFSQALFSAKNKIQQLPMPGPAEIYSILSHQKEELLNQGFEVQYLDCREFGTLRPLTALSPNDLKSCSLIIAGAVILEETRLIDNVILFSQDQ